MPLTSTTAASTTTSTSTTSTSTSTTTTLPPTTTTAPFDVAALAIDDGDPFARLEIPRIGRDDIVVAGVGREELKKGPGHYPQTPMPGQLGNSAIAGHRTTYGGPFLEIDELEPGDEIIVTTPYGRFVYRMTTTEIVDADNWQVIATVDPTVATLTLTSCHPVGTASQRIIVHAELDLEQSDTPGPAVFNYGRDAVVDATGALPGENAADPTTTVAPTSSTTVATTTTTTTVAETESSPATSTAATTSSSTPTTALPPVLPADTLYSVLPGGGTIGGGDDDGNGEAAEDAFSNHWFTDAAAWPQVAMWGALATGHRRRRLLRRQALPQQLDRPRRRRRAVPGHAVLLLPERQQAAPGRSVDVLDRMAGAPWWWWAITAITAAQPLFSGASSEEEQPFESCSTTVAGLTRTMAPRYGRIRW